MDLSSAVSSMSPGGSNGGGGGAVACPVCTLYLREGISLQKHLDTHPKEQVIEALIRASGAGGASALLSQACAPQPQQQSPAPAPTPTPSPGANQQQQQPPAASPSPHVPHAQSPYPIGPIFECPPINAMIPPPQFASFSYQQFVNNGTMMIPAQYAMAQAQAPPTSQMMQMLYSPYGMYHQQQIPTVQMISAPPAMMPTSTTTMPTTVPAVTTRMRPVTSTSNITITEAPTTTPMSVSPPRTTSCVQQQQQPEPQPQPQQLDVEQSPKQQPTQIVHEIIPGPDRILPDLEMPPSPEPTNVEPEHEEGHIEHREQQTQNTCPQEEQRRVDQYQSEGPPTLISNSRDDATDDDKTERILPDIEDNEGIESLIVRTIENRVESHNDTERQVAESVEHMEIAMHEEQAKDESIENIQCSETLENSMEVKDKSNDEQTVCDTVEPQDLTVEESRINNSTHKLEVEKIDRMLDNMESEFSNVELNNKVDEEVHNEKPQEEIQDALLEEPIDKHSEDDENTSVSYHKNSPEPIECKIIHAHEDTDVSSVASSDSIHCDLEIQKIMTSSYHYKCSHSLPTSPVSKKHFYRSLSRASQRSDFDHSNENLYSYPVGFEATSLQDYLKTNYNDEDMELEEPLPHSYMKQNSGIIAERANSHTPLSASISSVFVLKARRSKVPTSPVSIRSGFSYGHMDEEDEEEDEEDSDAESCDSPDEKDEDDEDLDEEEERLLMEHKTIERVDVKENFHEECKAAIAAEIMLKQQPQQEQPADFRAQSLMAEHYPAGQFPLDSHHSSTTQQQQSTVVSMHHETYPLSAEISQNPFNMTECVDPMTSTDSKSYSSSSKLTMQKPTTELLNISEDAHAGPINVFEIEEPPIYVPSSFISESSQKAVSGTSHQSMSSSENGAGNDEEVKSVNMRADETMPPRGELSEQESNGCTEQSAWQLYMGQDSSRMSTSYDLMARESWEESEGSDHEDNNGGPLLDSRSLATHFTASLFPDRDRKTPTRRIFKCSHCPEVFECPKERRVHSTMVHKEAGPSGCSNDNMDNQQELKDIKLLDGRANVFEDMFLPGSLQQAYLHQQPPLLHQLQPPQHSSSAKADTDPKMDAQHLSTVAEVTCTLCNQRFSSEKSLQMHHRRMHAAEPAKRVRENAKCQICSEEFTSVASFNLHLKIHPLECGQCGKYFYRKQNFKLHMKRHLGIKPFPCTLCDKAFLTKQKLDEHTNGHTGNAPVKCNLCNETFRRYSNLTQHKNRHHLNIKKKLKDYICHCGEVFHTKKKLAWHKETHDEKPKACTYCNERFIHMASLTRHMRRAHNRRFVPDAQRESENVECPICKCIYLRSSLAVHMRVHNGERPYECQVCSKAFSTKWNLQLHKWTHAARSTKPFKCNQCSAAFYRNSDYTAHINSHRNVRPYTCNYCGAQFIRKYNCLRHVKEHEENKAYTCDICNKTFHRSYYLKEHLRVHSGARPYTCHICGKSSSTKSNHNKHVRIHHAREPVNTEN
ncbi:hypothetical protein TSAR_013310 [Trichomalopsis sarcophagae]|uniref:C2H2-type domain-containing protein n=1 Tax=Trichomalopsis sarcophagae TaxID=543379 RepID=A0A232EYF5_9HYME|nr:hypothetical protein TSAR_013310 [Trichomalopsis sarcophagae]